MGGADRPYFSLISAQETFGLFLIHLALLKTMKETFAINTPMKEH